MSRLCGLLAFGLFVVVASAAWADLPGPGPRPRPRPVPVPAVQDIKMNAPVEIKYADLAADGKDVKAKIDIPRKLLAKLAVGGRVPESAVEPRLIKPELKEAPELKKQSSVPSWNTIIAGLALSGGAVGLVFVARGNRTARMIAVTVIAGSALAGGYALADLRVPEPQPQRVREIEIKGDQVVLQLTGEGGAIVITLPKEAKK